MTEKNKKGSGAASKQCATSSIGTDNIATSSSKNISNQVSLTSTSTVIERFENVALEFTILPDEEWIISIEKLADAFDIPLKQANRIIIRNFKLFKGMGYGASMAPEDNPASFRNLNLAGAIKWTTLLDYTKYESEREEFLIRLHIWLANLGADEIKRQTALRQKALKDLVQDRVDLVACVSKAMPYVDPAALMAAEIGNLETEMGEKIPLIDEIHAENTLKFPCTLSISDLKNDLGVSIPRIKTVLVSLGYLKRVGRSYAPTLRGCLGITAFPVYHRNDTKYRRVRWDLRFNLNIVEELQAFFREIRDMERALEEGRPSSAYNGLGVVN